MSAIGACLACGVGVGVGLGAVIAGRTPREQGDGFFGVLLLAVVATLVALVFALLVVARIAQVGGVPIEQLLLARSGIYQVTKFTYFAYGAGSAALALWLGWAAMRRKRGGGA